MSDCGQNITNQENGVITSPGYPFKYPPYRQICNWFITVRPKHKVLLFFEFFLIEGDPASKCHHHLLALVCTVISLTAVGSITCVIMASFLAFYSNQHSFHHHHNHVTARGCPGAVVRVWQELSSPPIELCGEGLANETKEFVSSSEMLRVSWVSFLLYFLYWEDIAHAR